MKLFQFLKFGIWSSVICSASASSYRFQQDKHTVWADAGVNDWILGDESQRESSTASQRWEFAPKPTPWASIRPQLRNASQIVILKTNPACELKPWPQAQTRPEHVFTSERWREFTGSTKNRGSSRKHNTPSLFWRVHAKPSKPQFDYATKTLDWFSCICLSDWT